MFGKKKITAYTDLAIGDYKVAMFRKIGGKYVCIDKIKIRIDDTKGFRYKGKDFNLFNKNLIGWTDSKCNYYAFDFDKQLQLTFNELNLANDKITLDDIDNYVNKGIIAQMIAGLEKAKSEKGQWIMLILGAVIGGVIGFVIGQYVTGNSAKQAEETAKMVMMLI